MSTHAAAHRARLAAGGALLALVLAACGSPAPETAGSPGPPPGDGTASPTSGISPAPPGGGGPSPGVAGGSPGAVASPTPTGTASPTPDDVRVIEVTVAGGEVQGVDSPVDVEQGRRVRLVVTADVTDRLHVHGYDVFAEVAPGTPGIVEFAADIPGAFEVELEDHGLRLLELRVRP